MNPCVLFVCNPYECTQIFKQFQSPCFSLPSKLFRTNFLFSALPRLSWLDHLAKKRLLLPWRRADYKGCLLFFRHTIKTCQEKLFDWLIIQSLVWVTYTARQDFTVHSQSLIPLIVNKSAKIFEKYLVSDLFHGYKDLARQSSWWSILFCVYVYIHWS